MTKVAVKNTNIESLNAFKTEVDSMGKICKEIVIKDTMTLAVASQNLAKANQLAKSIESKVKLIRKPYNDELKKISELSSSITKELSEGIAELKNNILKWETDRKEKELKSQKILNYISDVVNPVLQNYYDKAVTPQDCQAAIDKINKDFPSDDKFGEFATQAHELKAAYIKMLSEKQTGVPPNIVPADEKINQITSIVEAAKQESEIRVVSEKVHGSRMTWTFELQDIKAVPLDWLILDEEKVKAYLSDNKKDMVDGEVLNGVKFFKKMTISA